MYFDKEARAKIKSLVAHLPKTSRIVFESVGQKFGRQAGQSRRSAISVL